MNQARTLQGSIRAHPLTASIRIEIISAEKQKTLQFGAGTLRQEAAAEG
jgi:hypothetical protein